ncbi:MAG: TetR/AcrR family transcriptional regulator [Clostridiales bacterium]|jgi:AcrR family transcriptional regulator|nr:TetR/AcrR family transcriptional regulator [Clostridiales bacterium]
MELNSSKKKLTTHLRILNKAKFLFEKNGVTHVTIDDIAVESFIARSTFFTHFASLEDLYSEIANRELDALIDIILSAKASGERYDAVLKDFLSRLIDDTSKYPKTFIELFVKGILTADKPNEKFLEFEAVISDILQYASPPVSGGIIDAKDIYDALFGLYLGVVCDDLIRYKGIPDPEAVKKILYMLVNILNIGTPDATEAKTETGVVASERKRRRSPESRRRQ